MLGLAGNYNDDNMICVPRKASRGFPTSRANGFTLLEMAVVLLIAAFTFGAILKGQELVFGARVRALLGEHEGVRTAWLGFQDRFRSLAGDYDQADKHIRGVTKTGNGNGRVEFLATPVAGSSSGVSEEYILAWDHLTKSRFLQGQYDFATNLTAGTASGSVPRNLYGGFADIAYDRYYGDPALPAATKPERHTLKTGNFIPVAMLAEIDLKVDDGKAWSGGFQASVFAWFGPAPAASTTSADSCVTSSGLWRLNADPQPDNCGGVSLL